MDCKILSRRQLCHVTILQDYPILAIANFFLGALKYPRIRYTDLDDLICKKSEEEVNSEAEGGEHSHEACAPTCLK